MKLSEADYECEEVDEREEVKECEEMTVLEEVKACGEENVSSTNTTEVQTLMAYMKFKLYAVSRYIKNQLQIFFKSDRPFYLNGFEWTEQYAQKRDFKKELLHICGQETVKNWRNAKDSMQVFV